MEYREALLAGRDPSIEAKAEREAEKAMKEAEAGIPTFGQLASEVIATRRPVWSNAKHAAQWESTLTTYAFPVMGNKPGGLDHDRRRVGRAEANLDLETRDGHQDQATYGDRF